MVHWYKRDPDAALAGMIGLTMEERGAYNTVIDLLYARNGNVPNDDRFMARAQQCAPQMWRRVRDQLIAKGKIWVKTDGKLAANRVETTLKEAEYLSQIQSFKAKKRWKTTIEPMPPGNASTTTTIEERKKEKPSKRKKAPEQQPGFDQFWEAYPLKVGKATAAKAFAVALTRTDLPAVLAGLERMKPTWVDPRYIPHPTTWLNRGGWDDQPKVTGFMDKDDWRRAIV